MSHCEKHTVVDLVKQEGRATTTTTNDDYPNKKIKNSPSNDNDQVQVVAGPSVKELFASTNDNNDCGNDSDDDAVHVVGTVNTQSLPHMRCHCTVHKHTVPSNLMIDLTTDVETESKSNQNELNPNRMSCGLCYCYVCDVPVKECCDWSVHCDATDTCQEWQAKRQSKKPFPLTATLKDARWLKWAMDCLQRFVREVQLDCDANGIQMENYDSGGVCVVVSLSRDFFLKYDCQEAFRTEFATTLHLYRLIESLTKKGKSLTLQGNKDMLQVSLEQDKDQTPLCLHLRGDEDPLVIPTVAYSTCKMSSKEFRQIIQAFESLAETDHETVTITIRKNQQKINFSMTPNSTVKRASVTRKFPNCGAVTPQVVHTATITVRLLRLKQVTRTLLTLAPEVEICVFSQRAPLMFKYPIAVGDTRGNSYIKYYLGPAIWQDSEST